MAPIEVMYAKDGGIGEDFWVGMGCMQQIECHGCLWE